MSVPPRTEIENIKELSDKISQAIHAAGSELVSAEIGTALEKLRGRRLALDNNNLLTIETSPEQRKRGVYFTPPNLADTMTRSALFPVLKKVNSLEDLHKLAILDPAAGCGAFLLSVLRVTVELLKEKPAFKSLSMAQLRQEVVDNCIYGVDIDPVAITTVRALLIVEVGVKGWEAKGLEQHLHIGDSISARLDDWRDWFPERATAGFNVIVTNPPWSKLRPLRHEFFEHIDSSVRLLQGEALGQYIKQHMSDLLQDTWSHFVEHTIELSSKLRSSDEYVVNQASYGDPDLYKFFLERSIDLLSPNGTASLLVPSGVLRAKGSGPLRRLLRERGEIVEIAEYINRKKIFDIHSMYRFATVLFNKGKVGNKMLVRFGETEPAVANPEEAVYFEPDFLDLVGGADALIPEVRNKIEKSLLQRLYQQNPLSEGVGGDRLSFKREIDMTNDAGNFIDANYAHNRGFRPQVNGQWQSHNSKDVLLPVYEGRMVHQYNNTAKEYLSGHGRSAKWETPIPGQGRIWPHFFVTEKYARSRGWTPRQRVGYCEISGHANERTVLAALIPPYAICGNKVPVLRESEGVDPMLWLALANSIVIDWIVRRWVSTTINQFYWKNIPFPNALSAADKSFLKSAAKRLSESNSSREPADEWLGKRAQLRAAIDAVVMKAFGITSKERETILKDFPLFTKAASRTRPQAISINHLLEIYTESYVEGNLNLMTVHTLCNPLSCAATYATKEQIAWLKKDVTN